MTFSADDLSAVGELLQAAEQGGLGIVFEPDGDGWRVSYTHTHPREWPAYETEEFAGGLLANAFNLGTAANAALRPLLQHVERRTQFFQA